MSYKSKDRSFGAARTRCASPKRRQLENAVNLRWSQWAFRENASSPVDSMLLSMDPDDCDTIVLPQLQSSLLCLPVELIDMIKKHMDLNDIICLTLTCKKAVRMIGMGYWASLGRGTSRSHHDICWRWNSRSDCYGSDFNRLNDPVVDWHEESRCTKLRRVSKMRWLLLRALLRDSRADYRLCVHGGSVLKRRVEQFGDPAECLRCAEDSRLEWAYNCEFCDSRVPLDRDFYPITIGFAHDRPKQHAPWQKKQTRRSLLSGSDDFLWSHSAETHLGEDMMLIHYQDGLCWLVNDVQINDVIFERLSANRRASHLGGLRSCVHDTTFYEDINKAVFRCLSEKRSHDFGTNKREERPTITMQRCPICCIERRIATFYHNNMSGSESEISCVEVVLDMWAQMVPIRHVGSREFWSYRELPTPFPHQHAWEQAHQVMFRIKKADGLPHKMSSRGYITARWTPLAEEFGNKAPQSLLDAQTVTKLLVRQAPDEDDQSRSVVTDKEADGASKTQPQAAETTLKRAPRLGSFRERVSSLVPRHRARHD